MTDSVALALQFPQAKTIAALDAMLQQAIQTLGFTNMMYTRYAHDFAQSGQVMHQVCSTKIQSWFDHYWQQGYDRVDPVGQDVRLSNLPHISDLHQKLATTCGKARRLYKDAIAFGLGTSCSIPLHSANQSFAILVCYFPESLAVSGEQAQRMMAQALLIGQYYHGCLTQLAPDTIDTIDLTEREKAVLRLAVNHMSAEAIAEELNISKRTVYFHSENINQKLNAKNRHEAVQIALSKGLIKA